MRCTWTQAKDSLVGAACLWQDLDGLHRDNVPDEAPATSILWAWWPSQDGRVARLRIDEDSVYLAVAEWPSQATDTIAWGEDDGRIAQFRPAVRGPGLVSERFATAVVDEITFIRPSDMTQT